MFSSKAVSVLVRNTINESFVKGVLLGFFLLTNLVLLGVGAYSLYQSRLQDEARAAVLTENLAYVIDQSLAAGIDKVFLALEDVADEMEHYTARRGSGEQALTAFVERRARSVLGDDALLVTDGRGEIIIGKKSGARPANFGRVPNFVRHQAEANREILLSPPEQQGDGGPWVLTFSRRYNHPDGSFAGMVVALVRTDYLTRLFAQINVGPLGLVALRDAEGNILARFPHGPASSGNRSGVAAPELQQLLRAGRRTGTYVTADTADHIERTYSFRMLESVPLTVFAAVASEDYLQGWRRDFWKSLLFAVGFMLMSGWLARMCWRLLYSLKESEQRHSLLFDLSRAPILLVDAEADRIVAANSAASAFYGYSHEALLGLSVSALLEIGQLETSVEISRAYREKRDYFQVAHRLSNGELRQVEVRSWPIDIGGRQLQYLILHDVTNRLRLEEEKREVAYGMEQLVQQHIAIQTVAALAHQFNQPLSAIGFYVENGLEILRSGNPDKKALERILEGSSRDVQRAGQVLRQMFQQLHTPDVKLEKVDLNRLVQECINDYLAGGSERYRVETRLLTGTIVVNVNVLQTHKVVENLLRNAADAMHGEGMSTAVGVITVSTFVADGMGHVLVRDNGPGMSEYEARQAFTPFYTTKAGGIGMGLPISRTLAEAQGGKLWFEPTQIGAEFHLTVQLAR